MWAVLRNNLSELYTQGWWYVSSFKEQFDWTTPKDDGMWAVLRNNLTEVYTQGWWYVSSFKEQFDWTIHPRMMVCE